MARAAGDLVWYLHDEHKWTPAKVKTPGETDITVVLLMEGLDESVEYPAKVADVMEMHPSCLNAVDNMIKLADMSEAAVLHNLRLRYRTDDIYTYIGGILVVVNPYKKPGGSASPDSEYVVKYRDALPDADIEPHIYKLSANAIVAMLRDEKNQAVVISGESGAGKTECTKLCVRYWAEVAGLGGDAIGKEALLLKSSPILEAFGNAKTLRNNNSSRFGKYMEIQFNSDGKIVSGRIIKYLLEKSRIVMQTEGERNYHIFYQLIVGANLGLISGEVKDTLQLLPAEKYKMLMNGNTTTAPGWDDEQEMKDVISSYDLLQFTPEQQNNIWMCLGAVLWLGNCEFAADGEGSKVLNEDTLKLVSQALQLDQDLVIKTLTSRNIVVGGDTMNKPLTHLQADGTMRGAAAAVYSRMFDWIVVAINVALEPAEGTTPKNSIGALDIFGFEVFPINTFDQVCINYANEKLQYHFNSCIFMLELKVYKEEELDVGAVSFVDNGGCLDLIEEKTAGLFACIEAAGKAPKPSDGLLLEDLHKRHGTEGYENAYYGKTKDPVFIIKHYAGEVTYHIDGFLDKNQDMLHADVQALMSSSKVPLMNILFPPVAAEGEADGGKKKKKSRKKGGGGAGGKVVGVGIQFKSQMESLYKTLCATEPHFIKCIKPNNVKKAGVFDADFSLRQLQYLGLLEVIRIRKSGFPVRRKPEEFMAKYWLLAPDAADPKVLLEAEGEAGQWQIGKTLVFMKDEQLTTLEGKRMAIWITYLRTIQSFVKYEYAQKRWVGLRSLFVQFSAVVRGKIDRKKVAVLKANEACRQQIKAACTAAEAATATSAADLLAGVNAALAAAKEGMSDYDSDETVAAAQETLKKLAVFIEDEKWRQALIAAAEKAAGAAADTAAAQIEAIKAVLAEAEGKMSVFASDPSVENAKAAVTSLETVLADEACRQKIKAACTTAEAATATSAADLLAGVNAALAAAKEGMSCYDSDETVAAAQETLKKLVVVIEDEKWRQALIEAVSKAAGAAADTAGAELEAVKAVLAEAEGKMSVFASDPSVEPARDAVTRLETILADETCRETLRAAIAATKDAAPSAAQGHVDALEASLASVKEKLTTFAEDEVAFATQTRITELNVLVKDEECRSKLTAAVGGAGTATEQLEAVKSSLAFALDSMSCFGTDPLVAEAKTLQERLLETVRIETAAAAALKDGDRAALKTCLAITAGAGVDSGPIFAPVQAALTALTQAELETASAGADLTALMTALQHGSEDLSDGDAAVAKAQEKKSALEAELGEAALKEAEEAAAAQAAKAAAELAQQQEQAAAAEAAAKAQRNAEAADAEAAAKSKNKALGEAQETEKAAREALREAERFVEREAAGTLALGPRAPSQVVLTELLLQHCEARHATPRPPPRKSVQFLLTYALYLARACLGREERPHVQPTLES